MKPETFVQLAIAAVVAVALAALAHSSANRWAPGVVAGAKLAPPLAAGRGQPSVVMVAQGDRTLTLEARDNRWTIKERAGYGADAEKVRALIVKLAQAELIDAKTRKPDRYMLLELEDPKAKDAKSRLLKIADAKGNPMVEVIVGKRRLDAFGAGRSGTYVRMPTDQQTWLANADIEAPLDVRSWIKPTILEVEEAKIASLAIEIPGEEPLKIERQEGADAKAAFVGLPEGKKLKDAGAAGAVLRAVGAIDADDVRKPQQPPSQDGASIVRLAARDGLQLQLNIRKDGDAQWLSVTASGTNEASAKAADAIKARTAGWEFKIPSTKADAILKRRADLVESS